MEKPTNPKDLMTFALTQIPNCKNVKSANYWLDTAMNCARTMTPKDVGIAFMGADVVIEMMHSKETAELLGWAK